MKFLEHLDPAILVFTGVTLFLLAALLMLVKTNRTLKEDIKKISLGLRALIRSGRAPHRIGINSPSLEILWRKLLNFYTGTVRTGETKADMITVLDSGIGFAEAGDSEEKIFNVLSEIVLRSSYPEVKVTAVAVKENGSSWKVVTSSGISKERIEEPLLLAIDSLMLDDKEMLYMRPQDGLAYDYRAMGIGTSLFVPMKSSHEIIAMLWLGFAEGTGTLSESRKSTIEMIVQHAVASYFSARRSRKKDEVSQEEKEKMLSLSHDMKAPSMRALYALREIQHNNLINNEEHKYLLSEIEYALEEQLGLIHSLFSIESEEDKINTQQTPEIEISTLVSNRVASFKVIARAASIELSCGVMERAKVKIPREALHRIIDNLLSNAIKYTPEGSIVVDVFHAPSGKKEVVVQVKDSGKGVPERLQKDLFSSQIRNQEREINSGQGYGLTVVKRLSNDYGGEVAYTPNPAGGSIFSFTLPAVSLFEVGYHAEERKKSLLIIDDDAIVRSSHEKWLKGVADRILSCGSFSEARVIMEFEKPTLIITDASIPGEDVGKFLLDIQNDIPVVVVSARPIDQTRESFKVHDQVVLVLEKPFGRAEFREAIKKITFSKLNLKSTLERAA